MSFHSRQSFSVNFFHVSLGLPAPCLPSTCISHAVLIKPLERSTCPNQRSLLIQNEVEVLKLNLSSSLLDLTVATSSGLILQICLIIRTYHCVACAAGSSWLVAKFHWRGAWCSARKSCKHGYGSCKRDVGM